MPRGLQLSMLVAVGVASLARGQAPLETPGPRIGHSLVFDSAKGTTVLVDGYSWVRAVSPQDPPERTELWSWNGRGWDRLAGSGPLSRTAARAAYDAERRTLVSYGGRVGRAETPSTETWEWNTAGWRRTGEAPAGPSVHVEMAYDAPRRRLIRFGGATPDDVRKSRWPTDTWAWDGASWTRVATEGPEGRAASNMVYDDSRREIVLFGGQGSASAPGLTQPLFGDTWTWNGERWRRASESGPPARSYHAMAFDACDGVVLVHGGGSGASVLGDLWAWDGERWKEIPPGTQTPGKRRLHAMSYDPVRRRTVLYGGAGPDESGRTVAYDDTWEWDGARWSRVIPGASTPVPQTDAPRACKTRR